MVRHSFDLIFCFSSAETKLRYEALFLPEWFLWQKTNPVKIYANLSMADVLSEKDNPLLDTIVPISSENLPSRILLQEYVFLCKEMCGDPWAEAGLPTDVAPGHGRAFPEKLHAPADFTRTQALIRLPIGRSLRWDFLVAAPMGKRIESLSRVGTKWCDNIQWLISIHNVLITPKW